MLKPLSATKGEILHKILFIPFVGVGVLIMAGIVWALASIEIVGPQQTPEILSGQFMSKPTQVEFGQGVTKSKTAAPTQRTITNQKVNCQLDGDKWITTNTADQCRQAQKDYYNQLVVTHPLPTPKAPYPVCVVYYPTSNMVETYTTFSPEECSAEKLKASGYQPFPTVNPNIVQDALNQLNHINDNLKNITIVEHTPTPNPCSNLGGSAQISGGSCN